MTTTILTQGPTEADLEAEIHGVLRKAFPWLPPSALKHQIRFSFRIGRNTIDIDGAAMAAEGRTDILVYAHDKPLAVFELKRQGHALTPDDELQGLSYAKVMTPPFPLVVLSNGDVTRILAAHSGAIWEPETPSEEEFQKLVTAAGRAATSDLKQAVSTLMASNPMVWRQSVRAASNAQIDEMCGTWDAPSFPFVQDFLFPRKATLATLILLRKGQRFLLVEGPPLIGKSNLLREMVNQTSDVADMAVLFVAADDGRGVIQSVADLLASALSWPVTIEEARHWLMQISRARGPSLVLAVDGIDTDNDVIRREIENLSSAAFGAQLRLVMTVDNAAVKKFMEHPNGRQASAIGRRVDGRIALGLLDDEEFMLAAEAFFDRRMGFQYGAASALELRVPWILRALGGHYAPSQADSSDKVVVLPAQLSLDLIGHSRARFLDDELRRQFREVARGVLQDAADASLTLALKLEAITTFVVRHTTLLEYLDRTEIDRLMAHGFLKPVIHESSEPVLFVALPEFLASEASIVLGEELLKQANANAKEAARWLVAITSCIPLGDIIAAHAFLDAAQGGRGLPLDVVEALVDMPPRSEPIPPGMTAAAHVPEVGMMNMTFEQDGSFTAEINGKREKITLDPSDLPTILGDYHPWLILSHLTGQPMVYGTDAVRLDHELLGKIGSCQYVLRRPDAFLKGSGVLTHHVPGYGEIVCHMAGIVEPITYSLFKMLSSEGPDQEAWIDQALAAESLGLLTRIDIALRATTQLFDPVRRPWAERMLREKIGPALRDTLHAQHGDSRCQ